MESEVHFLFTTCSNSAKDVRIHSYSQRREKGRKKKYFKGWQEELKLTRSQCIRNVYGDFSVCLVLAVVGDKKDSKVLFLVLPPSGKNNQSCFKI